MNRLFFPIAFPKRSHLLWLAWLRALQPLRPACCRSTTFLWLLLVVVLVDGLKRPKEGRKMPAVKSLHQESRCNAKASFIMGHSLQAVALLVQVAGVCLAVPVAARIHEGVVWSARDRRTLLDKLSGLLLGLQWSGPLTVVADAYYAAAKFARALLTNGHHLVTRVRSNAVAYFPPSRPRSGKRRGRRTIYGPKTHLRH